VAPAAISVIGHLCFASLLLAKWEAFEEREGGPLIAANLSALNTGAPGVGPSWFLVFLPAWLAEAMVILSCVCALYGSMGVTSINPRIGHFNGMMQSTLSAAFKWNLLNRLETASGSWLLVFWPLYVAFGVQTLLHACKEADNRNRRPGFPFAASHLLAIVISFKLSGIYSYDEVSWANVLWPVWGIASFFGAALFAAICCGVPILLRRCVISHLASLLLVLFAILLAFFIPALVFAVRLTLWLDGEASFTAAQIIGPYLAALILLLLLMLGAAAFMGISFSLRAARAASDDIDEDSEAEPPSADSLPGMFIRESSTLFRPVAGPPNPNQFLRHLSGSYARPADLDHDQPGSRAVGALPSSERQATIGPGDRVNAQANDHLSEVHHDLFVGNAGTPEASPMAAGALLRGSRPQSRTLVVDILDEGDLGESVENDGPSGASAGGSTTGGGFFSFARCSLAGSTPCSTGLMTSPVSASGAVASGEATATFAARSRLAPGSAKGSGDVMDDFSAADGGTDAGSEPSGGQCWICFTGPREAVLLQCGHGGLCYPCAERCWTLRPRVCPLCREKVTGIVKVAPNPSDPNIYLTQR